MPTLDEIVREVLAENPRQVALYHEGKALMGYFVGRVALKLGGFERYTPRQVNTAIDRILREASD